MQCGAGGGPLNPNKPWLLSRAIWGCGSTLRSSTTRAAATPSTSRWRTAWWCEQRVTLAR